MEDLIEVNGVSPAKQRTSDAVVHRATQGLIRLESRRRMRKFLHRLVTGLIVAAVLAGLGYYFAEYWDLFKDKLILTNPID